MSSDTKRFIGLALSGTKNQKTAFCILEFYPKEKKIFLLDILSHLPPGDEPLIKQLKESSQDCLCVGVNAPLSFPVCTCTKTKECASKKWAKKFLKSKSQEFTCYTQRPIEVWIKQKILSHLPESHHFEIDETLGGTKAPITARMNYLKNHLTQLNFQEVLPKLTIAVLGKKLELTRREITSYRKLDDGNHAREQILNALIKKFDLFIYLKDLQKLTTSLQAFDAFICAFTSYLESEELTEKKPKAFPSKEDWILFPKLTL